MNTKSLLEDVRADSLKDVLGFQTKCGAERFDALFSKQISTNIQELQKRQDVLFQYKQNSNQCLTNAALFGELKQIEPTLQSILHPTSLEKESMEQILFPSSSPFQIFNTIPFFLLCISLWKQFVVPILAVCMPLFFFLAPFVTMKYYYNLPISFSEYTKIFCVTLGIPSSMEHLQWKQTFQLAFTSVSLGQSIYQPIQTSFHVRTIDADLQEKARALLSLKSIFETLYPENTTLFEDIQVEDPYCSFAAGWDLSYRIQIALWMIGDMEVIHRVASCSLLQRVRFQRKRVVKMTHLVNPLLEQSKPISFLFTPKRSHCLVTGPNGGGKSTVLRSILLNILFAQTLGVCFGQEGGTFLLDPFDWIQSGLHLEDLPGKLSLFEREVEFASQALHRARRNPNQRGLLLFDELFHSTNPPDGERTARIFLEQIWKFPHVSSMISTHVFSLAESSSKEIQKLCVPATKHEDGTISFSYCLQNGICKVSSVDLVLHKCGFFPPGKPGGGKE
jgi:hypothetical protein